jgi:hypothetical protein
VRGDLDPNSDLKLRFFKYLINIPLKIIDKLVSFPRAPHYAQTVMVMDTYAALKKVYDFEVAGGIFTEKNGASDGNFERLITVAAKLMAQVCERDRYYRSWIGLAFLLAEQEAAGFTASAEPAVLKRLIKEQWLLNLDFVPDAHVEAFRKQFVELALCEHLGNLARMPASELVGTANYKNKQNGGLKQK